MSKKNDDKRGLGEFRETAFYAVLPLLCIASLLRGCSAMSAEVPEAMREREGAGIGNCPLESLQSRELLLFGRDF